MWCLFSGLWAGLMMRDRGGVRSRPARDVAVTRPVFPVSWEGGGSVRVLWDDGCERKGNVFLEKNADRTRGKDYVPLCMGELVGKDSRRLGETD